MNAQKITSRTERDLKGLRAGVLQVFDNGQEDERDRFTVYYGGRHYYQLPADPFASLTEPTRGRGKVEGEQIPPSQLPESCRLRLQLKGIQIEGERFFFWPGPHGRFIRRGEGLYNTLITTD